MDTPGIEENEQMERYLMEYIEQNQILRFMYIIMSDHVGGVQENRVCRDVFIDTFFLMRWVRIKVNKMFCLYLSPEKAQIATDK